MILSELFESIVNLMFFVLIPFLCWVLFKRNEVSFFQWIGIKKPKVENKEKFWLIFAISILFYAPISLVLDMILPNTVQLASQRFYGLELRVFFPILIFSFIKTGLSEEIFFRGFLGKNLIKKFGFGIGNSIQSLIFGLLHGVSLYASFGLILSISIILFTGTFAWLAGYINEKCSDGSIIPSWCLHGIANTIACLCDAFQIVR